jgi:outer membrane biosynthesis protein TonB
LSTEDPLNELTLREQIDQSEGVLDSLEADLCAVERELESLAQEHHKFEVLKRICGSLDELDELGAAQLFWDSQAPGQNTERLAHARRQIKRYHDDIAAVEDRREAIFAKIESQNVELDYLHYDLTDIIEREENRAGEWVIEREPGEEPKRALVMPWARGAEEDRRFRRSLTSSLAASVAVAMILSMIAIPIRERAKTIELPERVARLVREERRLPPPPPPMAEPEIQEEIEPEPELVEELRDEPMPTSSDEPQLADAAAGPDNREKIQGAGILAFRDSFASRADLRPTARLGSQARVSAAGERSAGRPERMMVSTSATGSSGGINLADYSRDFGGGGGGGVSGVQVARVASSIGGGGGGGTGRPLAGGGGASAGRTDEEIQIVFDRYKAALYRLYNRELRKDPTLRGQLVLRLTIEPDGSVSLCELHSSTMQAPVLADQVLGRVRAFDFGAKEDIVAVTIIYPIDFLPAA